MLSLVWWCAWIPMITGCPTTHTDVDIYVYNAWMCAILILASSFNNCPIPQYSSQSQLFSYHLMIIIRNRRLLTALYCYTYIIHVYLGKGLVAVFVWNINDTATDCCTTVHSLSHKTSNSEYMPRVKWLFPISCHVHKLYNPHQMFLNEFHFYTQQRQIKAGLFLYQTMPLVKHIIKIINITVYQ